MALTLYSFDEAIDRKFIVTKSLSGQATQGTLVHIMDCVKKSDGSYTVYYRVTGTGQDFTVDFDTLKQFCKWARADNFIARHYDNLGTKDVMHYIKVTGRTFTAFYLPILVVLIVLIWVLLLALVGGISSVILGAVLSIAAAIGIFVYYKRAKKKMVLYIYSKVSKSSWGVILK